MNLLFSVDRNATKLLVNCIKSVVKNGGDHHYNAYILQSDIDKETMESIREAAGETVNCSFLSVSPDLFDGFPISRRYPKQIYYRLAAPLLLPSDLDRILYLDVDTVVINPLDTLYEMDFEGTYYIACTHTHEFLTKVNQNRLGMKKEAPYINSGVMMLNLPMLRKNLRMEDIRDYANEKKHTLILPDQDIITALYGEKVKLADTMRYNLSDRILAFYNANPKNDNLTIDWIRKNSVIIHYCGKNKPWKEGYNGVLDTFYKEVLRY